MKKMKMIPVAFMLLAGVAGTSANADIITGSTTDPGGLGLNLAASANGGTISDVYTPSFPGGLGPDKAIDGLTTTGWSSQGGGLNAFIEIDFAGLSSITHIGYMSRGAADGSPGQEDVVNSFRITFSDSSSHDFVSFSDATALDFQWYALPTAVVTSSIRFDVLTAGYDDGGFINNTGARELQAFGAVIPESSTFVLMAIALCGLVFVRRKK